MTESDKTGEKLAASIRKTRTGAATQTTATPTRKTAPRRAPATVAEGAATTGAVRKDPTAADPYSHGRRVWPD